MIGVQPNTTYLGRNSDSNGTPFRFLPFKPSPSKTSHGRNLFSALINSNLSVSDQVGTPYQFSFIISLTGPIAAGSIYNNSNASLTYDVTLNLDGTISFSVTDVNGTSTISTVQALETGWSYELTFQYTYNGEFIPLSFFPRSDFMGVFINGIRAVTGIDLDGDASVAPALAASTLAVTGSADYAVAAITQWWSAWWVSGSSAFAWQWWYYWWNAWWWSSWYSYWQYWWWWYVYWDCDIEGCDPSDCGPNLCHPEAPFDQLYQFDRFVGDVDFVLTGIGIRDINTNTSPAVINITIPGTVIKAYLYWEVIGGGAFCADTAVFNGNSGEGTIVGCTGNTCWTAYCVNDGQDSDDTVPDQNLLNKVWLRDVTSLVPGSGSYTVSLPTVVPGDFINTEGVHYPGCNGGNGIALLVIYESPQLPGETREIITWHGARLLKCNTCTPPTIGGSESYSITWNTKYSWKGKIATAVGDPQAAAPPTNSLLFNSIVFTPQPKYFNPNVGNLMHVKTEYLPPHSVICNCGPNGQENTVTAMTNSDCLCWFLFVYSGVIKCAVVSDALSSSQNFISPPTPLMSLWNPNPPDCCPVRLPCCGDICLPGRLNVGITAPTLECSCLATQGYIMNWNRTEQKYIMQPQAGVCGCTLFGWLYCVGSEWTLYLELSSGDTVCSNGVNASFPINCSPFGGVGNLQLNPVDLCDCGCVTDLLSVSISMG